MLFRSEKHYTIRNRFEFFKFFKASVNNHIRGIVHRERFTIRRTGRRPPPRGQAFDAAAALTSTKNVEVSLDDEESGIQVGESSDFASVFEREFMEDAKAYLNPVEYLVMEQLASPNMAAMAVATIEAYRGCNESRSVKVAIKTQHLAEGIGLPIETFKEIQENVRRKVRKYMDEVDTSGSAEYQAALSRLEEIFELQVPRSVDRVVVRRLMTLVARDHHAKVTPEVKADLEAVGAEPPALKSGALLCFGVLYQKNHRSCAVCGMAQEIGRAHV